MNFRKFGQVALAAVVSTGLILGVSSCANDYTVGYVYVLGTQYNQIGEYKEDNNNGILKPVVGNPVSSAGTNPVRAIIPTGSRFMYVLNAGSPAVDSSGNITYTGENISVFSIGGYGQITFQQSYNSQGNGPIRIATDAGGAHLFVLDSYSPIGNQNGASQTASTTESADFPCYDASANVYRPAGDITVFGIDTSTGRLSLITNQQQQNETYFPVGCGPIDFHPTSSYIYTADAGTASAPQTIFVYALSTSTGQLTQTQNAPLETNAQGISSITGNTSNSFIYVLDAVANAIIPYSVGSGGALTNVNGTEFSNASSAAGNPQQLISVTGDGNSFVYIANAGPAGGTTVGNSDVSGYVINASTGALQQGTYQSPYGTNTSNGAVSGAVCLFEDTSNQYIYVAGSIDNSVVGFKLDPQTGSLASLNKATAFPVVGTPSWCLSTAASSR